MAGKEIITSKSPHNIFANFLIVLQLNNYVKKQKNLILYSKFYTINYILTVNASEYCYYLLKQIELFA